MTQGVVTVQGLRLRDGPGGAVVAPSLDKGVGVEGQARHLAVDPDDPIGVGTVDGLVRHGPTIGVLDR